MATPRRTAKSKTKQPAASAPPVETSSEATTADRNRKERVIHTRVPAVLEIELKRFADGLRVPVSNLIRTILEDAVAVADRAGESVERELLTVAQRVGTERERMREAVAKLDPLEGVYGFQPLTLHVKTFCVRCNGALEPGTAAHCALSDAPGPRRFVCDNCLPSSTPAAAPQGD